MMKGKLYLTDKQYVRVLRKIEAAIACDNFRVSCSDCTMIGNKSTDSNCGFCNDAYVGEDMALFPDQYPERMTMKYRWRNHRCPFDMSEESGILGWGYGCFSRCYLFKHLGKRDWNLSLMREMVDHIIEVAK